jgi:hypothetical protein
MTFPLDTIPSSLALNGNQFQLMQRAGNVLFDTNFIHKGATADGIFYFFHEIFVHIAKNYIVNAVDAPSIDICLNLRLNNRSKLQHFQSNMSTQPIFLTSNDFAGAWNRLGPSPLQFDGFVRAPRWRTKVQEMEVVGGSPFLM